jgi:branched-chain amino acid transport system substrate-binding protein
MDIRKDPFRYSGGEPDAWSKDARHHTKNAITEAKQSRRSRQRINLLPDRFSSVDSFGIRTIDWPEIGAQPATSWGADMTQRKILLLASILLGAAVGINPATAQKKYDPGASDTEIKIGNIMPYSGPLSAYALIGRTQAAFFRKLNDEGGINGRKINFISYDDAFSPPKTVEQARKLVESDEVLLIFQSLGTPTNNAIQKYLDGKKVPQLFVATGATKFGDPKNFPWTMGWQPTYQTEGRIYAKYILQNLPQGKIGVLYQNDDSGRDYLKGLKDGLGPEAARRMIVAELPYDPTDPTVDSQIVSLKTLGADIFFDEASPKFAAQAIRKAAEIGWKPTLFLASISNSVGSVLKPAGLENSKGVLSSNYIKDPTDPAWKDDPAIKEWSAFMDKYFPEGDKSSTFSVYGYATAQTMVQVLKQCGDELTRENIMKQAANLKDFELGLLLPGIKINTSPTDYFPIEQMQMSRFNGEHGELFGSAISSEIGTQ